MKYNTKVLGLLLTTVIVGSMICVASAQPPAAGPLWEAVFGLQGRVGDLENTADGHDTDIADLQSRVEALESQVATLETTVADQQAQITTLEGRTSVLESQVADQQSQIDTLQADLEAQRTELMHRIDLVVYDEFYPNVIRPLEEWVDTLAEHALVREPDYDSGWVSISPGEERILTHNLGTTEVFVYVIGGLQGGIHQFAYGGTSMPPSEGEGVIWWLQDGDIFVARLTEDQWWEEVRVMIWRLD